MRLGSVSRYRSRNGPRNAKSALVGHVDGLWVMSAVVVLQKVYVENAPMFAELRGFKAVKAVAEPRKSSRTKAVSKKKK